MFGVDAADLKAGNVLKIMRQIAQSQAKVSATDSHTNLSRWLGLDDSMIRLLQQGSTGVQQLYDDEYALSKATEENTQKAAEAAQAWRQFENTLSEIGATIATDLTPALKEVNTLLDGFSKWIAANPGAASKIGIGGAVAVSAGGAAATGAAIRVLTGGAAAAGGPCGADRSGRRGRLYAWQCHPPVLRQVRQKSDRRRPVVAARLLHGYPSQRAESHERIHTGRARQREGKRRREALGGCATPTRRRE
jgi:hypothetical protein